jgi:outer membrane protein assembly factor BamB
VFICGLLFLLLTGCSKTESGGDKGTAPPAVDWPVFRGDAGLTGVAAGLPERLTLDFALKAGDEVAATPVIAGGRLYAATVEGGLVAFDIARRAKLWEYSVPDGFEAAPLVVSEEKLVVIGGIDGAVYAIDAETGKERWRAETEGKIAGSGNVFRAGGRTLVLVGSWDHKLYAFDAATGRAAWAFSTANYVNGAPAIGDGLAALGGCDARLHLIDCASGREKGLVDTGAYIAGSAAIAGGVAYVGNYAGRLLAVDASSRRTVWSFGPAGEEGGFSASPAVADCSVVMGGKDSFVYCLDRASGRLLWKYRGRDEYQASCVVGSGRALAASADGELALLALATGRLLATCDLGAEVSASPACAAGYVIVAARDGNLYFFKGE